MKRILITGALGQIGSELITYLRKRYGRENVIASDIKPIPEEMINQGEIFEHIDCLNAREIYSVINPQLAWKVNINGLYNLLEIAREYKCAVFSPSSIAAFGPSTPKDNTPQETIQRPNTIYGLTKVTGELLCDYYYSKYEVDTRGLRFPGLISYITLPGGGTTDYAVEIFYEALRNKKYTCFLDKDTYLDMMYMPDALKATVNLMEADPSRLKNRNAYNVTAESFNPEQLAYEIKKYIPDFEINYDVDPIRQAIANSWPNRLDDTAAREDWGWSPDYNLEAMTKDMIEKLKVKLHVSV
jgi:nucleoside-diphosphate-sugar epimerase